MARFFGKKELILIVLLILLFDFNNFTNTVIPHITFKNQQSWVAFIIASITLFVDLTFFRAQLSSTPYNQVFFTNNKDHTPKTCSYLITQEEQTIKNNLKNLNPDNCSNSITFAYDIIQKILFTMFAIFLVIIFIICITSRKEKADKLNNRIIRGIPLLIFSSLILIFTFQ